MDKSIQWLFFCAWFILFGLSSRFIFVLTYCKIPFFLRAEWYSTVCIDRILYLFICWLTFKLCPHYSYCKQFFYEYCYCCLVAKSRLTLCNPMDCSTPVFPDLQYLPELALMSIDSMMPSNHLILCPFLLLPSIFPSITVFSNESGLCIR